MAATKITNYRLGSNSNTSTFDQDFDFVESYIRFFNKTVSSDELKSLRMGYISALYKYKSKLLIFLKQVQREDFPRYHDDKVSELFNIPISQLTQSHYTQFLDNFAYEIATDFDIKIKYIENTKGFTDDIVIAIQKLFMVIAGAFCFDFNIVSRVDNNGGYYFPIERIEFESETAPEDDIDIRFGSRYCYLPNDTGFFGLNTWLYSYFMGIDIIGVPSRYNDFDYLKGSCPGFFIIHDYGHLDSIRVPSEGLPVLQASIYKQIFMDPEATPLQQELLLTCLWGIIHEGGMSIDSFSRLFVPHITREFETIVIQSIDMLDEFIRFKDLVVTQETLDVFFDKLDNYPVKDKFELLRYHRDLPRDVETYTKLLNDDDALLDSRLFSFTGKRLNESAIRGIRSKILWSLMCLYFRDYCIKYYDLNVPNKTPQQVLEE